MKCVTIDDDRKQTAGYSCYAGKGIPDTFTVDCFSPGEYYSLKENYQDFTGLGQWELDEQKKQKLKDDIDNLYDNKAKKESTTLLEDITSNVESTTTDEEILTLLCDSFRGNSEDKKAKKTNLNNKSMQELIEIYNALK
jgi:hypothetical protein